MAATETPRPKTEKQDPTARGARATTADVPGTSASVSWDGYEEFLAELWERMTLILGSAAVQVLMCRAIQVASRRHATLSHLAISDSGLDFDQVKQLAGRGGAAALRPAFREFVLSLFDILGKLTGDVLVKDLEEMAKGRL